jgi:hypothetical protein
MGATNRLASSGRKTVQRDRTERDLLEEISTKLDRVVAVLAAQDKPRNTQMDILTAAGFDSGFIGTVVGLHPGAVRKYQSMQRRAAQAAPMEPSTIDHAGAGTVGLE